MNILLIVANPASLVAADIALRDHLALSHTVTVGDDDAAAVTGQDLIIHAPSAANESNVATNYKTAATPFISLRVTAWQDMGLTSGAGSTESVTQLVVLDAAHALAAGMSGTQTITTAAANIGYVADTTLSAAADKVLHTPTATTRICGFGYETGDTLPDTTVAAERRVGLGFGGGIIAAWNATTKEFLDAAVAWAANVPTGGWQVGAIGW